MQIPWVAWWRWASFWGDCTFLSILHVGELPELMPLMARDRSGWPRCLGIAGERAPWAASLGQLADRSLEEALGAHLVDDAGFWSPPEFWDSEDLAIEIGEHPCV